MRSVNVALEPLLNREIEFIWAVATACDRLSPPIGLGRPASLGTVRPATALHSHSARARATTRCLFDLAGRRVADERPLVRSRRGDRLPPRRVASQHRA